MIDSNGVYIYFDISIFQYSDNVIRLLDRLLSIHLLSVCLIIVFDAVFVPRIPIAFGIT